MMGAIRCRSKGASAELFTSYFGGVGLQRREVIRNAEPTSRLHHRTRLALALGPNFFSESGFSAHAVAAWQPYWSHELNTAVPNTWAWQMSHECRMEQAAKRLNDMTRKAHKIASVKAVRASRQDLTVSVPVKPAGKRSPAAARVGEHAASGDDVVQMHANVWNKR